MLYKCVFVLLIFVFVFCGFGYELISSVLLSYLFGDLIL